MLDVVLGDLAGDFPDLIYGLAPRLASSASKAHRYVAEMQKIASTQQMAGLPPELFQAIATVWECVAATPLGRTTPEQAMESSTGRGHHRTQNARYIAQVRGHSAVSYSAVSYSAYERGARSARTTALALRTRGTHRDPRRLEHRK